MSLCIFLIILICIFIILIIYNKYIDIDNNYKKINNYNEIGDFYLNNNDYKNALNNYKKVFIYDPNNENIPIIRRKIDNIQNKLEIDNNNNIFINYNDEYLFNNDINDYIIDYNNILPIINIDEIENNNFNELDNNNNIIINDNNNLNNNRINNDLQNVHDSVINKTINSSIDKLEKTTKKNNSLFNINSFLLDELKKSEYNDEDKNKIQQTIEYINKNKNLPVGEKTLQDNLLLIGNRIINNNNNDKKKNMIHNLLYELKECVRADGNMYCTTGIANRIVDSLNGIDDMVIITPKWAIHEEMMGKSSIIRNELEKIKSVDDNDFNEVLKEKIKTELKKEYVDNNKILSEDDFNKEINEWINYI